MLFYSLNAFDFCLNYVRTNNLQNSKFVILGLKLYNKLKRKQKLLKQLGIKTYVNPDGLEWQRDK